MNYLYPMAIEYGMTAEEFWYDDPQLFVAYRNSYLNKKNRELEEINYICWLQGLYNFDGNSKLVGRLNQTIFNGFQGFSDKPKFQDNDFGNFPEKPYNFNETKEEKKKNTKENNYKEYNKSLMMYGSIKKIYLEKQLREG